MKITIEINERQLQLLRYAVRDYYTKHSATADDSFFDEIYNLNGFIHEAQARAHGVKYEFPSKQIKIID